LMVGVSALHEDLRFEPGAFQGAGLAFVANDPGQQAMLQSVVRLSDRVTWSAQLREVGPLPHPQVPGYVELNTRIGWDVTDRLQVSLSGFNLFHAQHQEFIEPGVSSEVPRSIYAQMRVRF
jgi:iron complex outermembrane receptor protein